MSGEIIDAIRSLTTLMNEETELLGSRGQPVGLADIAAAKVRLTGQLQALVAEAERETADWMAALDAPERTALLGALDGLRAASAPNADMLKRQIELSAEMMAAVAAEAQRMAGTRRTTYGVSGTVSDMRMAAPIVVNTSL